MRVHKRNHRPKVRLIASLGDVLTSTFSEPSKCSPLVWLEAEYFCEVVRNPGVVRRLLGILFYTLFTAPSCITAVMTICRFVPSVDTSVYRANHLTL